MGSAIKDILKTAIKNSVGFGSIRSYSQFGEDLLIQNELKNTKKGFYVDVGAYHPTLYSNTYRLYKKGWRGIVIDPNKSMRPLFNLFRPRDNFVLSAISNESGEKEYYVYADGAYNSLNEVQVHKVEVEKGIRPLKKYTLQVSTLSEVLKEKSVTYIDYLNIDVEGMDLQVLEGHDWNIRPRVITVEDSSFNPEYPNTSAIYEFLNEKNYQITGMSNLSIVFVDSLRK